MIVPQTLPASRDTVEKSAAAKASVSPTMASRKRTQICDSPSQRKRDPAKACGLVCADAEIALLISLFSSAVRCCYQNMTTQRRVEVTEETFMRGDGALPR